MSKFIGVPLPTEEGLWWWSGFDEDTVNPMVVEVIRIDIGLVAGMGQHGWNWDQPVGDMGGEWMKVVMPRADGPDISLLDQHLLPGSVEGMEMELAGGDATKEILFIASILHELGDSTRIYAEELEGEGFDLWAEEAGQRAEKYHESWNALKKIWGCQ